MATHFSDALQLPEPPVPMTAMVLMSYLESIVETNDVECKPVLIDGHPIVNATVVDGHIVLRTWLNELNSNPPCPQHNPVQHRDGKPPWCHACGLTANWDNPHVKVT